MTTTKQVLDYFNWINLPKRYAVLDNKFKVSNGDTVIDCGAQYGDISLYMSCKVGITGKVYAIEASARIFPFLVNNSKFNNTTNIVPILRAISNCNKVFRLYHSPSPSGYSILEGAKGQIKEEFERIRGSTLDSIVKEYNINKVDAIYMNIEGSEYLAIDGMEETITKFKPFLYIYEHKEFNTKIDIKRKLEKLGYESVDYDSEISNLLIAE